MGGRGATADQETGEVHGVKVLAKELSGVKFSDLKNIAATDYKKQIGSGVVILSTSAEDGNNQSSGSQ